MKWIELPIQWLKESEIDYNAMGIEEPEHEYDVNLGFFNIDNISVINESSDPNVTTLRTIDSPDGYRIQMTYYQLKTLIETVGDN